MYQLYYNLFNIIFQIKNIQMFFINHCTYPCISIITTHYILIIIFQIHILFIFQFTFITPQQGNLLLHITFFYAYMEQHILNHIYIFYINYNYHLCFSFCFNNLTPQFCKFNALRVSHFNSHLTFLDTKFIHCVLIITYSF